MLIIQILSFFKISYLIIITEFWIPSIFMLLFLFFVQHVMLDGFQI
jgi:CHASE2 domain-containing sensor protein